LSIFLAAKSAYTRVLCNCGHPLQFRKVITNKLNNPMKKVTIISIILYAAIQQIYAQGGFLLNQNGVELNYQPILYPGLTYYAQNPRVDINGFRIGAKLRNVTAGISYFKNPTNPYSQTDGLGLDVGYDWNWKNNWGLNSGLAYNWYTIKNPYYTSKGNALRLGLHFYKKIDLNNQKNVFIKPFLGVQIYSQSLIYQYNYVQSGVYYSQRGGYNNLLFVGNIGIALGVNVKNWVLGITPNYSIGTQLGVQLSAGYNFQSIATFHGGDYKIKE
jgi:hypothetical protein